MSLQGKGKGTPRGANARTKVPAKCTLNPATKFKGRAHSACPVGAKAHFVWTSPYLRNSSICVTMCLIYSDSTVRTNWILTGSKMRHL